MSRYQGNVLVDSGQTATFNPPIDGIYVLSDYASIPGATDCVINGQTVSINFSTLVKGSGSANSRHILLPNCTQIEGSLNFKYVTIRDAGYPPKAPTDSFVA